MTYVSDHRGGVEWALTVFLNVLAAAVHHPGHLAVDGVEAQPFVPVLLILIRRLERQRELQGLEEAGLVVVQVRDGVHRHGALRVNRAFFSVQTGLAPGFKSIRFVRLTLRRARGGASGVLGDVDSLAVSDVELKEELLLDNSFVEGRLVANCKTGDPRVRLSV